MVEFFESAQKPESKAEGFPTTGVISEIKYAKRSTGH